MAIITRQDAVLLTQCKLEVSHSSVPCSQTDYSHDTLLAASTPPVSDSLYLLRSRPLTSIHNSIHSSAEAKDTE